MWTGVSGAQFWGESPVDAAGAAAACQTGSATKAISRDERVPDLRGPEHHYNRVKATGQREHT